MKAPEISRPLEARRSGPLKGVALVPGDKSISHRALILGALAVGETKISGLLEADDVLCTAAAMRKLGVTVLHDDDGKNAKDAYVEEIFSQMKPFFGHIHGISQCRNEDSNEQLNQFHSLST